MSTIDIGRRLPEPSTLMNAILLKLLVSTGASGVSGFRRVLLFAVALMCWAGVVAGNETAGKPKIAVFSGPTATIQNSRALITSNKARIAAGFPPLAGADGLALKFDELFPQRLAAPATIYIEQFTAHPLESDVAELYSAPDGYIGADGVFSESKRALGDKPVYRVIISPEDGLYPLPFMGMQANGRPWDNIATERGAPFSQSRQTFYPDASRIFEEIERSGGRIHEFASFDFYRPAPSGGYTKGLPSDARTDTGEGDIAHESLGADFFTYGPYGASASRTRLAVATNLVAAALASGEYAGAIWLEGSPSIEDSIYWLGLLIDTTSPLIGSAAQRIRGSVGADGDANIVDAIDYITSRVWADEAGRDRVGAIMIQDNVIYNAREVQKGDARPGGYSPTGGYGGIVGTMGYGAKLTFLPVRKSTFRSEVRLSVLPASVTAVARSAGGLTTVPFATKDSEGFLLPSSIPYVGMFKTARWMTDDDSSASPNSEVDILARLDALLGGSPQLAGFIAEGLSPYGSHIAPVQAALDLAVLSGYPVVRTARGDAHGFLQANDNNLSIEGNNLTSTKARILLMACLLRFGALPPARDPLNPTTEERSAIIEKIKFYQRIFDTH